MSVFLFCGSLEPKVGCSASSTTPFSYQNYPTWPSKTAHLRSKTMALFIPNPHTFAGKPPWLQRRLTVVLCCLTLLLW